MNALMLDVPLPLDAGAISVMAQAVFRQTFAFRNYPADDLAAFLDRAMSRATFAAQIADPDYGWRIARGEDGRILGFIKTGPNDLPLPPGEPPVEVMRELHQLYLTDEAKGSGVADVMMAWAEADARRRGARAMFLSVYIDNHRARRFYARHGYVEIGPNPFAVGRVIDDDRVWRKWL